MKSKTKIIIAAIILIGMIGLFYFAIKIMTNFTGNAVIAGEDNGNGDLSSFTSCLENKNVKMYGAYWCGHCQNQKAMFGNSEEFLNKIYVECDYSGENPQSSLCVQKGINGYPTWEINGQLYPGEQSLERLAELSGCSLS